MPEFTINSGTIEKVGLWHGTVIQMNDGKRFKITKLNPKNVRMMDTDGKDGYTLNRAYAGTIIAEDQTWDGPKPKNEYELYQEATASGILLGSPVEFTGANGRKFPGTYICIAKSNSNWRFAEYGGNDDRYVTFPVSRLAECVRPITKES